MADEHAQQQLDEANAEFWSELCGTGLARKVGVTDASSESLARFDRAYMEMYPYLERYLPWRSGERVLEIGLGYGTVGQLLAQRGLDYHGLDISPGPVAMMIHRLEMLGVADARERVTQGSALTIPHPGESFDVVVSIGCLHHTGDLAGAISEVRRVLRRGGRAMVMVYNSHSFRHAVVLPFRMRKQGIMRDRSRRAEFLRATYDASSGGDAAPATQFSSAADVRRMFAGFSDVRIRRENFDEFVAALRVGPLAVQVSVDREALLGSVARVAGLDLYVVATR